MNTKKRALLTLVVLALFVSIAAVWFFSTYKIVSGGVYAKDAETVDLRGKAIELEEYELFRSEFPESNILWDVPFQGSTYSQETDALTVTTLTQEDVQMLAHFPQLTQLDARECRDYAQLESLIQENPQLQVLCSVELDGTAYTQDANEVRLNGCTPEELTALKCLTKLETIQITNGIAPEVYTQLQAHCQEKQIEMHYTVNGELLSGDTTELTLTEATDEDVAVAALMTQLKTLHLTNPTAQAENVLALQTQLPNTQVTWEMDILGMTFSNDATEIDLTDILSRPSANRESPYYRATAQYVLGTRDPLPSAVSLRYEVLMNREDETQDLITELEAAMEYFPNLEQLVMVGCFLDNEAMAAFREAHREDYKVVWTVKCGDIAPRTDAKYFMPAKYNVYTFTAEDGINLKYCEEVESIDIGHMHTNDVSFVRYMPNLKYLVLGENTIKDISPLSSCKNLKFLEIQRSRVDDLTPLLECTALEDLNIGTLWDIDLEVVKQMTWLKNLWMATFKDHLKEMEAALPNTTIKAPVDTTVINNGWRELPNYYAARDMLLMYYME